MNENAQESLIIAYDLGTGGNKAAIFNPDGVCLAEAFVPYDTFFPRSGWHEQRPEDWWQAIVKSTHLLFNRSGFDPLKVFSLGISGHSLGVVPLDGKGRLLRETTPIWSDTRSLEQASRFFNNYPETDWYLLTGNGFPPSLYSVFKILWYRDHEPEMFSKIDRVVGTKDYINYRLTGFLATDPSYASGCGVYDLVNWKYSDRLIAASGLPKHLFPEIVPSTQVIGHLTDSAADELGLPKNAKVVAGGVDNSCMALGAGNTQDGKIYNAQGSSSWIALTSTQPLLDINKRPFVFAHVIPGLFNSAIGVFSTGSSFRWVRDHLCKDLAFQAELEKCSAYDLMTRAAEISPPGANGLIFHPNLAGGSSIDPGNQLRGAFLFLDLRHTQADMIRAVMEGIAFQQRVALDVLRSLALIQSEMIVVGGGSQSQLWRQIHADAYQLRIVKTCIDQQAAALGAAALAAVGIGLWDDFSRINNLHQVEDFSDPIPENIKIYERILPVYQQAAQYLSDLGSLYQV